MIAFPIMQNILPINPAYFVLQTVVLFIFIYCLVKKFLNRNYVAILNKLPRVKLRSYHIFGHTSIMLPYRIFKKRYPLKSTIYDFIALTGYNYLFREKGLSIAWQFNFPCVMIFKADIVEIILSHSTEIKKAWFYDFLHPWLGTGLLTSCDEKWASRRKLLTPAFHFNILRDFVPVFNKQSKILVEILQKHTRDEFINIVPFVTLCSLDIICESILGKEMHTQKQPRSSYVQSVKEFSTAMVDRIHLPHYWSDLLLPLSSFGRRFLRNKKTLRDFTNKLISDQKKIKLEKKSSATKNDDTTEDIEYRRKKRALLDLLLDEHINNNSISEEDIREEVDTFTFEGHDTTSMGMSWALYLIGLHPWVQEKVHRELDEIFGEDQDRDVTEEDLKNMKYLECVLKESMRLYPSVPIIARELKKDLNLGEYTVSKGCTCLVFTFILHRDPEHFPNPEKFDPDRFSLENSVGRHPFAYVPFSAGPRNCIGQKFALMEEKIVLSSILRKYKVRSLDPRDRIHLLEELVLRSYDGLRIQIRRRSEEFDFHSVYYRP